MILLAGYSSIPQDIHDAAAVDGAGFWRHYFQVTLPLILPISLVALLFGLIFTFTDMVIIYNLTRGGPFDTTQVLASLAFYTGIAGGDLAEGAAIALFLFPCSSPWRWASYSSRTAPRSPKAMIERIKIWGARSTRWGILGTLTFFFAFPFVWMLITTFKRTRLVRPQAQSVFILRMADPRTYPSAVLRNALRPVAPEHGFRRCPGRADYARRSRSPPVTLWRGLPAIGARSWASASSSPIWFRRRSYSFRCPASW